jgi:hypothetical protein
MICVSFLILNISSFLKPKGNVKNPPSSEEWSLPETSTLLFYMHHMCMPRNSFLASLEQSAPDDIFEELRYRRHLIGVNITDSTREAFQREKLIPFLKNVTHSSSMFQPL